MTRAKRSRVLAILSAAIGTMGLNALAADQTWSGNGGTGGTGTWNTSSNLWDGSTAPWVNANNAIFGGPGGTVTLAENINAVNFTVNTTGYTFDLAGKNLDITGSILGTFGDHASTTFTNTSGSASTLTSADLNTGGPFLSGSLNVTYTGTNWSSAIGHDFTGTLWFKPTATMSSIVASNNNLGSASGLVKLDGTTAQARLNFNPAARYETYTRNFELIHGATTFAEFTINGGLEATLSGVISGGNAAGDGFRGVNSQGAYVLTGANTYTGITRLTGQSSILILANAQALGNSTGVVMGSTTNTLGISGGFTLTNTTLINIGTQSGVPTTGWGHIQSMGGNNVLNNNITWGGSATPKIFGVDGGSQLTVNGTLAGTAAITKTGYGTLVLTNTATIGAQNGSDGLANTFSVNEGRLVLDFSGGSWETSPGVQTNLINNGVATTETTTRGSFLVLGGGTLEVKGKNGYVNTQNFKLQPNAGALLANAFTINPGASAVKATQNGATSLTINLGKLFEGNRKVGGTVEFTLPTTGSIILPALQSNSVGADNAIMRANGAAFATVVNTTIDANATTGNDWAATSALASNARNIIAGSSIGGFYTANDGDLSSGVANMDVTAGDTSHNNTAVASMRFNTAGATTLTVNGGQVLTTGGILITSAVGSNLTTIAGGTVRGHDNPNASATLQDLTIIQNNTAGALRIDSVISNAANGAATGLTKSGSGRLILTGANTYTGATNLNGGMIKLEGAGALGSGQLVFHGGVLGMAGGSSFTRALGASGVAWASDGGFAAYGGNVTVNLGGAGASVTFGSNPAANTFVLTGSALIFGASDSTGTVIFENAISLRAPQTVQYREFRAFNGAVNGDVDGRITGVISGDGGFLKTGDGTLQLSAVNSYSIATIVDGGKLLYGITNALPNTQLKVKSGTLDLATFNDTFSSTKSVEMGGGAAGTTSAITGSTGIFTLGTTLSYLGSVGNDDGATISGNLTSTAVRTFDISNSTAAAVDLDVSAVVSGSGGGITKTGAGTMRLSSGSNSYTGATNVNGGTLLLSGNIAGAAIAVNSTGTLELATTGSISSNSTLAVNAGGTLKGSGTIARATTVNSGGRVEVGNDGIGTLTVADLVLTAGSFARFEINSLENAGNYDHITGTITYAGTLEVDFSQYFGDTASWDLFDGAMTGNFTLITDISNTYQPSDLSFDNSTGVLSVAVPEPASLSLLALGAGALLRRRRRFF